MTSIHSLIHRVLGRWLAELVVIAVALLHVLVEMFSITYNFSFICQCIFIWLISSGREIFPLLKYPGRFLYLNEQRKYELK